MAQLILIDCYPLHHPMEGGERGSQQHYGEYSWLGPDLTQNTQGQYILIFPAVVGMLTLPVNKS